MRKRQYMLFTKFPRPWEWKLASWLFGISFLIVIVSIVIESRTTLRDCKKKCEKLGYGHYIYHPRDEWEEPACECCDKLDEWGDVVDEGCSTVVVQ